MFPTRVRLAEPLLPTPTLPFTNSPVLVNQLDSVFSRIPELFMPAAEEKKGILFAVAFVLTPLPEYQSVLQVPNQQVVGANSASEIVVFPIMRVPLALTAP